MDALTVYERLAAEHAAHLTGGVYSSQHRLEVVHGPMGYQYRIDDNDVTREMALNTLHDAMCRCPTDPRDDSIDYSRIGLVQL